MVLFARFEGGEVSGGTLVAVCTRWEIIFDAKVRIGFLIGGKARAWREERCENGPSVSESRSSIRTTERRSPVDLNE